MYDLWTRLRLFVVVLPYPCIGRTLVHLHKQTRSRQPACLSVILISVMQSVFVISQLIVIRSGPRSSQDWVDGSNRTRSAREPSLWFSPYIYLQEFTQRGVTVHSANVKRLAPYVHRTQRTAHVDNIPIAQTNCPKNARQTKAPTQPSFLSEGSRNCITHSACKSYNWLALHRLRSYVSTKFREFTEVQVSFGMGWMWGGGIFI